MLSEREADGGVLRTAASRERGRGIDGKAFAEADVDEHGDGAAVVLDVRAFNMLDRVGELERRAVAGPLLRASVEIGGRAVTWKRSHSDVSEKRLPQLTSQAVLRPRTLRA